MSRETGTRRRDAQEEGRGLIREKFKTMNLSTTLSFTNLE